MNVFTTGTRHQPWVWQVTGLCFVLGLLVAGSLQTVKVVRKSGQPGRLGGIDYASVSPAIMDTVSKQTNRIRDLLDQNTKLENTLAKGDDQSKALNEELQKMKLLAGISEVKGPGVTVTLQDSKHGPPPDKQFDAPNYIIHDWTIQQVINELNASGAEAISINGQRYISRTPIRCVGPTALVNEVPIASPFEIRAIGNPDTLTGALNIPGGVIDSIRSFDPEMVRMDKKPLLDVPAYSGSVDFKYAKPVRSDQAGGEKKGGKRRSREEAAAADTGNAAESAEPPDGRQAAQ